MAFDPAKFIGRQTKALSKTKGLTLVAVSGGVDSAVSAELLRRAGCRVKLIAIDTGYQREGEMRAVAGIFRRLKFGIDLIDAKSAFMEKTGSSSSPEQKRRAFREVYFDLIIQYARKHKIENLVQGTQFHKLTTQIAHNAPTRKFFASGISLVEPVRGLRKEEIRRVARTLNLPPSISERMPFPGPGLLIRFSGKPTGEKLRKIRLATRIVDEHMEKYAPENNRYYQLFPFLLSDSRIPYINRQGRKDKGDVIFVRSLRQDAGKKQIKYSPCPINKTEILVDKLLQIGGIARVCLDLTPKNGFGDKVKPGGSIEYS